MAAAEALEVCEAMFVDTLARRHPDLGLALPALPLTAGMPCLSDV